jgi:hypothetical protein
MRRDRRYHFTSVKILKFYLVTDLPKTYATFVATECKTIKWRFLYTLHVNELETNRMYICLINYGGYR